MTDKDPKDMTASELLRYCRDREASCSCFMCNKVLNIMECGEHVCSDAYEALADKIDAELAEAKEKAAHATDKPLSEVMAFYTGLYAKDAEPIGDWLDRWFIPRPRFEDGEPVQFGEVIELHFSGGGVEKGNLQEVAANKGPVMILSFVGVSHAREYRYDSECDVLKRPAPEVLGADGLPIVEGETVYVIESGIERTVSSVGTQPCDGMDGWDGSPWAMFDNGSWMHSRDLTHTPPDTQERIDGDKGKNSSEYWGCRGFFCVGCPAEIDGKRPSDRYGVINCSIAQGMDMARRQAELDARKGGE